MGGGEGRIERPRTVACVGSLVLVVEEGGRLVAWRPGGVVTQLREDSSLASYCVLATDGRERVVLGSLKGVVTLATLREGALQEVVTVKLGEGKIQGAVLLEGGACLVSCAGGRLVMVGREGEVLGETLLLGRHPWLTVGVKWGEIVAVGCREGGVRCYSRLLASERAAWPGLHGRQGVTALALEGGSLWSAGRDGALRRFHTEEGGVVALVQEMQCGAGAWVAGIHTIWGKLCYTVWRGSKLQVIRALLALNILLKVRSAEGALLGETDCGGGHRSWAVREGEGGGEVVYLKEGQVLVQKLWGGEDRPLVTGGHSQQVCTGGGGVWHLDASSACRS